MCAVVARFVVGVSAAILRSRQCGLVGSETTRACHAGCGWAGAGGEAYRGRCERVDAATIRSSTGKPGVGLRAHAAEVDIRRGNDGLTGTRSACMSQSCHPESGMPCPPRRPAAPPGESIRPPGSSSYGSKHRRVGERRSLRLYVRVQSSTGAHGVGRVTHQNQSPESRSAARSRRSLTPPIRQRRVRGVPEMRAPRIRIPARQVRCLPA